MVSNIPHQASPSDKLKLRGYSLDLYPGISSNRQCLRLNMAILRFPLTALEIMRFLGICDPQARVAQLRKSGKAIETRRAIMKSESVHWLRVGLSVLTTTSKEVAP